MRLKLICKFESHTFISHRICFDMLVGPINPLTPVVKLRSLHILITQLFEHLELQCRQFSHDRVSHIIVTFFYHLIIINLLSLFNRLKARLNKLDLFLLRIMYTFNLSMQRSKHAISLTDLGLRASLYFLKPTDFAVQGFDISTLSIQCSEFLLTKLCPGR